MTADLSPLAEASWPLARVAEALEVLGLRAGLRPVRPHGTTSPPSHPARRNGPGLDAWLEASARWLALELEPVHVPYAQVDDFVRGAAPALVRIDVDGEPRFVAVLRGGRRPTVLTPELRTERVAADLFARALRRPLEAPVAEECDRVLAEAGVRGARGARARLALVRQLLPGARADGCWLLRRGTAAASQFAAARVPKRLAQILGAHVAYYSLWLASWWVLGWMAFGDRLSIQWLTLWLLLLATLAPLRVVRTALSGLLAIDAGVALKQRMLVGALKMDSGDVRHFGAGQLLGRVLEAEAIESLALAGGLTSLTAAVELVAGAAVLALGAAAAWQVPLLGAWVLLVAAVAWGYFRQAQRWTVGRLDLTNALVEDLVGHRTRLIQEGNARWLARADAAMARYCDESRAFDRKAVCAQALLARGWLVAALLALAPAVVGGRPSAGALAVTLGGVLLAYRAFRGLSVGVEQLSAAVVAWERMAPFLRAASRPESAGHPTFADSQPGPDCEPPGEAPPVLEARSLALTHPGRSTPTLRSASVRVRANDRILLEGPSGGGKSTLASVLAASRLPDAGLVLLRGMDLATVGTSAWRRRVVLVPQFHENHVVMGTFAFNVLMGRSWPPTPADMERAECVSRALGLGELLDRMPAGMLQLVGETGWQLSHGERSRLYMARALVQDPELLILDESFAALDPETLRRTVEFTVQRGCAIIAVAHP